MNNETTPEETECVYMHLPKSQAKRFKQATDKEAVLLQYMADFKKNLHSEFECMDEDILAFQGMLARAKARFTEVKKKHLADCYDVWEKIDAEMPDLSKRAKSLEHKLNGSIDALAKLSKSMDGVNGYRLKDFIENAANLARLLDSLDDEKLERLVRVAEALTPAQCESTPTQNT